MDLSRGRLSRSIEDRRGLRIPGNLKASGCGSLLVFLDLVFFVGPDSLQLLDSVEQVSEPEAGYTDQWSNRDAMIDGDTEFKRRNPSQSNEISVRLEPQADCLAGGWAHHGDRLRKILEPEDLEEGLTTAAAIGAVSTQRTKWIETRRTGGNKR